MLSFRLPLLGVDLSAIARHDCLLDWRVGFSECPPPPNCPFSLAHPVFACLRSAVAEIRSSKLVFSALSGLRLVFMADSLGDFVVVIGFANRFSNDEHCKSTHNEHSKMRKQYINRYARTHGYVNRSAVMPIAQRMRRLGMGMSMAMSSEIKTKTDAMERPPSKKPIQKFVVSITIERAALEQAVDRGGVRACVGGGWVAAAKWDVHKTPYQHTNQNIFCFS